MGSTSCPGEWGAANRGRERGGDGRRVLARWLQRAARGSGGRRIGAGRGVGTDAESLLDGFNKLPGGGEWRIGAGRGVGTDAVLARRLQRAARGWGVANRGRERGGDGLRVQWLQRAAREWQGEGGVANRGREIGRGSV